MRTFPSILIAFPILLAGCDGGGASTSSGTGLVTTESASVSIAWPARNGRFVPNAASSVVAVTLSDSTGPFVTVNGTHSGVTENHASVKLGAVPITTTSTVMVNAISDGIAMVSIS